MKRLITLLTLAAVLAVPSFANAEIPPVLREGTHPMWAAGTMGPVVGVRDPEFKGLFGYTVRIEAPTQFGFFQTFGYHFSGRADGPAIAVDLQEGFGDDWIVFAIVPKFVWDIRIVPGLGLYLSPMAGFGFMTAAPDCGPNIDCDNANGLTLQFGFEGKLILGDRGLVFFRPFHLEVDVMSHPMPDEFGTTLRYGLLFGGGVIF
jgi:hypothetical protein